MRGRKASPEALAAVERVLKGESVKAAAAAEGVKIWNVYHNLKRRDLPVSLVKIRLRSAAAQKEIEDAERREAARKVVIEAGLQLQRVIVDRAVELLAAGRPPAAAFEILQREDEQRRKAKRKRKATSGRGLPAIGRTFDDMQAEIEELRERVRQLSATFLNTEWIPPAALKLTAREQRIIAVLVGRKECCTKQQIMDALYGLLPGADEPLEKIVDVFVCKARAKLKPFDCHIETVWGRGYQMLQPTRDKLKAMAAAELESEAA